MEIDFEIRFHLTTINLLLIYLEGRLFEEEFT